MQVDDAHIHYCASKQQQEPSQVIQQPAAGDGAGPVEATEIKQKQEKQADTAMQSEELLDGSFTSSKDASATTQTPKVSRISESELDALYASLDAAKKELAQTRQKERAHAAAVHELKAIERERDRYRATVLSLAYQNKVLNDELNRSRKGYSRREEKYVDARLQIQDLKEALALKEKEVEELKAARDYMPISDKDLLDAYHRMRDVFESLRSTLSCSLCYELYKPGDVTTLECGHTMCRQCLQQWNDSHIRLYNLATTPDCPECRQPGRHYVKVFLLEEIVRTVDRLERLEAEAEAMKQADRKAALEAERTNYQALTENSTSVLSDLADDTDEEAEEVSANLLGKANP